MERVTVRTEENKYTYKVEWSEEDDAFVAFCVEFPSLAAHGKSPAKALEEIMYVVKCAVKDMQENGEEVPEPVSAKTYKGRIPLRIPPALHKRLALRAFRSELSLNEFLKNVLEASEEPQGGFYSSSNRSSFGEISAKTSKRSMRSRKSARK